MNEPYKHGCGNYSEDEVNPRVQESLYFNVLRLAPTKHYEVIQKAYKKQMKKCHPDRGGTDFNEARSLYLNEAHDFLEAKYRPKS